MVSGPTNYTGLQKACLLTRNCISRSLLITNVKSVFPSIFEVSNFSNCYPPINNSFYQISPLPVYHVTIFFRKNLLISMACLVTGLYAIRNTSGQELAFCSVKVPLKGLERWRRCSPSRRESLLQLVTPPTTAQVAQKPWSNVYLSARQQNREPTTTSAPHNCSRRRNPTTTSTRGFTPPAIKNLNNQFANFVLGQ